MAIQLSEVLLKKRLIACAQINGPISSIYTWKSKIEHAEEFLLQVKTKRSSYKPIENLVLENHPYQNPEIIVIEIVEASKPYLEWIDESIS